MPYLICFSFFPSCLFLFPLLPPPLTPSTSSHLPPPSSSHHHLLLTTLFLSPSLHLSPSPPAPLCFLPLLSSSLHLPTSHHLPLLPPASSCFPHRMLSKWINRKALKALYDSHEHEHSPVPQGSVRHHHHVCSLM